MKRSCVLNLSTLKINLFKLFYRLTLRAEVETTLVKWRL